VKSDGGSGYAVYEERYDPKTHTYKRTRYSGGLTPEEVANVYKTCPRCGKPLNPRPGLRDITIRRNTNTDRFKYRLHQFINIGVGSWARTG
jgi:hypothetical protein